jgi:hypothetical protein
MEVAKQLKERNREKEKQLKSLFILTRDTWGKPEGENEMNKLSFSLSFPFVCLSFSLSLTLSLFVHLQTS